ncbi:MAG: hypothetical protein EZS28_004411 [Streblomastix strix]|uniref:Uncharacterized protein n=1 Tax=Streblomastix strix TaxID=222440 RepID=A0A5J4WZU5_9EUKA|nr:MAG: hypothetical protein EZS28_004411 [Streblomastix strix]
MNMVGRVIKRIKICETNDQDYGATKRKEMMNIINSEDRFSEEKGQLFIAQNSGIIIIKSGYLGKFVQLLKKRSYLAIRNKKDDDDEDTDEDVIRMKGINEKNSVPITQIQLKNGVMSMVKITKSALTGVVDKMIVINSDISKSQSYPCAIQIMTVDASNYLYM